MGDHPPILGEQTRLPSGLSPLRAALGARHTCPPPATTFNFHSPPGIYLFPNSSPPATSQHSRVLAPSNQVHAPSDNVHAPSPSPSLSPSPASFLLHPLLYSSGSRTPCFILQAIGPPALFFPGHRLTSLGAASSFGAHSTTTHTHTCSTSVALAACSLLGLTSLHDFTRCKPRPLHGWQWQCSGGVLQILIFSLSSPESMLRPQPRCFCCRQVVLPLRCYVRGFCHWLKGNGEVTFSSWTGKHQKRWK